MKNILAVIFFQFLTSLALAAPPITHVQCVGLSADQAMRAFPTFYHSVTSEGKKWVAANIDFTMENFRQVKPGNRDLWYFDSVIGVAAEGRSMTIRVSETDAFFQCVQIEAIYSTRKVGRGYDLFFSVQPGFNYPSTISTGSKVYGALCSISR